MIKIGDIVTYGRKTKNFVRPGSALYEEDPTLGTKNRFVGVFQTGDLGLVLKKGRAPRNSQWFQVLVNESVGWIYADCLEEVE